MNLQLVLVILVHVAFVAATGAGASKSVVAPSKVATVAAAGDPLASIDSEIFDSTQSGEQKYKRALAELDSLLGAINQEIETKSATGADAKRRTKREAYGGGWGGWGHEEVSYGHGGHGHGWGGWSPPVHHHRVHHHRHHYGISPEFLLKTALVLKGILVLGHVAALG